MGIMVRTSERELHKKSIGKFEKKWNIIYLFCMILCNLLEMYLRVVGNYRSLSSSLTF